MKILFLHSQADPSLGGGGEVIVWEQMRGLRDAGHECVLLATSSKPGLKRIERDDGIVVWLAGIRNIYWPYPKKRRSAISRLLWHAIDSYNPFMQKHLRKVVELEKPDVASVHAFAGWSISSVNALQRLNVPVVQILHGHEYICPKATMVKGSRNCSTQCTLCHALRLPHRQISRRVKAVVGVSHYILERHRELEYFEGVPVHKVIHNARRPETLGAHLTPSPSAHSTVRFGYLGRLDPPKGIEALIRAFLNVKLSNAEMWVAGTGEESYERHLKGISKDARINFLGRVSPQEFFPEVDFVVVPSICNDNFPSVVFEALAFGKPVLGSKRGGIPEMIRPGENGLLFDPDVSGELEESLRSAYSNAALRAKLSRNAKPSSRRFMDVHSWVSEYVSLYKQVIEDNSPAPGAK